VFIGSCSIARENSTTIPVIACRGERMPSTRVNESKLPADVWFVGQALDRIVHVAELEVLRDEERRDVEPELASMSLDETCCTLCVGELGTRTSTRGATNSGKDRAAPAPSPRSARRRPAFVTKPGR
jgi:hypothetical protein